ncbi:MAG: hypothetical protein JO354_12705 [Verrucomicrobia bacterium]|nr:hypothetical protein [Verrucomicrobiota bacterium]
MRLRDVEAVVRALNGAEVKYLIVGGLAVMAHGYMRLTIDIDLVVKLERDNVLRAMEALRNVGYRPAVPVPAEQFADDNVRESWRREKNMLVFQMYNPDPESTKLDLFITEPFDFEEEYAAAEWLDVAGIASPVLRLTTLIKMKKEAGRPKDLGDAGELEHLLEIQREEFDD